MYRFLDFLETTVIDAHTSFDKGILLKEIDDYKRLWAKYEHCQKANPFYHEPTGKYNIHRFDISGEEAIFIIWDVGQLNEMSFGTPLYRKSLKDFKAMFKQDNYDLEFETKEIYNDVKSVIHHEYNDILIMFFEPLKKYVLIDGRHRAVEYMKFKPTQEILFRIVSSNNCISSIMFKKDLLAYGILNNARVIADVLDGRIAENYMDLSFFHEG